MKLQTILQRLQKLHPKEIDLSLDRVKNLCKKLGNPQNNLKYISVVGTNGKYSTIQAIRAILKEAKEINNSEPITHIESITAAYFYYAKNYKDNLNIIESGLFHRFDATNIIDSNLASIVTSIGLDHLDWLPENEQTIEKIVFEKTSSLLNSKIIVSNQSSKEILELIKKSIDQNKSEKVIFNENFSYSVNENGFIYYEDEYGPIKLPKPNILGDFQIDNITAAIATV